MSKKFKLVYEDNGMIKGSYSGIPSKDDVNLIERAVLEGSKPVPPAPTPTPADPTALVRAIVPLDFGTAAPYKYNAKKYYLSGIDAEALEGLISFINDHPEWPELKPAFRFTCDGIEYVIANYDAASETSIGGFIEYYANDISGKPIEPTIFNHIEIEVDTEDPQIALVKE